MQPKLFLFTKPGFLIGLLLLLANDFYFKYAYPSFVTGKLSDFAGLFIFPYFFSVFFQKNAKIVYAVTALYFTYWKLEISQPYIDWLSSVTHLPFYRIVDVTDLIALLILPVSYNYFRKEWIIPAKGNLAIQMIIILISCFSFVATKVAREELEVSVESESGKKFIVHKNINEIIQEYMNYNTYYGNDSFPIDEFNTNVYVEVELKEYGKNQTLITLKKIKFYEVGGNDSESRKSNIEAMEKFTKDDFERYFGDNLVKQYHIARLL